MDEKRLKGMMGFCVRAGQAVFGAEACGKAIASGTGGILLADGAASQNTVERYRRLCGAAGVRLYIIPAGLIEEATGKPGAAMFIRGGSFEEQISGCLSQDSGRQY